MKKNDFHGKAIYEPSGKTAEYSNWACNLYNGCPHSCTYCFNDHNIMAGTLGGNIVSLKNHSLIPRPLLKFSYLN